MKFPYIATALQHLANGTVMDGEVVVADRRRIIICCRTLEDPAATTAFKAKMETEDAKTMLPRFLS